MATPTTITTKKNPKKKAAKPALKMIEEEEEGNAPEQEEGIATLPGIPVSIKSSSFNTSRIKHVILPKFRVGPKSYHGGQAEVLEKSTLTLVFGDPELSILDGNDDGNDEHEGCTNCGRHNNNSKVGDKNNANLFKEILALTSQCDILDLEIDFLGGTSVWKFISPKVCSIDFGDMAVVKNSLPSAIGYAKNSELVLEIDYSGISIDGTTFWCHD